LAQIERFPTVGTLSITNHVKEHRPEDWVEFLRQSVSDLCGKNSRYGLSATTKDARETLQEGFRFPVDLVPLFDVEVSCEMVVQCIGGAT